MLLSKSCQYGLRASLYLASLETDDYVSIRRISEELKCSFHFLTKILQQLTEAGLLRSYRGPGGGVRLARPAAEIRSRDVLEAIDGANLFTECVLGLPGCGDANPCPLHAHWAPQRARLAELFDDSTLAELSEGIRNSDFRISAED